MPNEPLDSDQVIRSRYVAVLNRKELASCRTCIRAILPWGLTKRTYIAGEIKAGKRSPSFLSFCLMCDPCCNFTSEWSVDQSFRDHSHKPTSRYQSGQLPGSPFMDSLRVADKPGLEQPLRISHYRSAGRSTRHPKSFLRHPF